jgi:hypothetical protein
VQREHGVRLSYSYVKLAMQRLKEPVHLHHDLEDGSL